MFANRVHELSEGRLRADLYPAGEAGGEVEMVQDIRAGALDMAYPSSAGYALFAPALGVFDIPFLFRDTGHARGVLDGPIGQAAMSKLDGTGLVGLAWGENGLRHITTAAKPVRNAQDLAGLKIRVPQSPVMVAGFRAMGADVQPLSFPDLYAALASGDFQAQENPLATIRDARFDRVQHYICLTGHVYSAAMIVIAKPVFDRLAPGDAKILREAAVAGAKASRDSADAADKVMLDELRQNGMTVVSDIDRASFIKALDGAQKGFADQFGGAQIAAIQHWGL